MLRNTTGQTISLLAWDTAADEPINGDALNITGYVSIDGAAFVALTDTNPTDDYDVAIPATKGHYHHTLTQAETDGRCLVFTFASTTSDVFIGPIMVFTIDDFSATQKTSVQTAANAALIAQNLDHLIKVAKDTDWATTVTKESVIDLMTSKDTDQTFSRSHESLEAIRDRGDLAWLTGAGVAANLSYLPASVTKVVGGTLTGDHTNLQTVSGAPYCSLAETTTGTFLELNVGFTGIDHASNPATLRVWGYYAGGGSHYIRVQAYNYTAVGYEDVGSMPIAAIVTPYTFSLSPNHFDSATGAASIKFLHNSSASGIGSHVLYLDKVEFDAFLTPLLTDDGSHNVQILLLNVADQQVFIRAINGVSGDPVTGDAANITAKISIDGAAAVATNDVNPTEVDSGDAPGEYYFVPTAAETDGRAILLISSSTTANVVIRPVLATTRPPYWLRTA